jgi:hypothetical protein
LKAEDAFVAIEGVVGWHTTAIQARR